MPDLEERSGIFAPCFLEIVCRKDLLPQHAFDFILQGFFGIRIKVDADDIGGFSDFSGECGGLAVFLIGISVYGNSSFHKARQRGADNGSPATGDKKLYSIIVYFYSLFLLFF